MNLNISHWICIKVPVKSSDLVGRACFPRPTLWPVHCNLTSIAGPLLLQGVALYPKALIPLRKAA